MSMVDALSVPIVKGPLAGYWWAPASGGKIARVLLGSYEREQTVEMQRSISPGDTFLDVGAHHGYYTLLASQLVGSTGRVVAMEPDPHNQSFLRRHVSSNRLKNVQVMGTAVGATQGYARFAFGTGTGSGRVDPNGELEVPLTTLDEIVSEGNLNPTHVKLDVEGAEGQVLEGGLETLEQHRPILFLSTHGAEVHAECLERLQQFDYQFTPILGDDIETTTELIATPASATATQPLAA